MGLAAPMPDGGSNSVISLAGLARQINDALADMDRAESDVESHRVAMVAAETTAESHRVMIGKLLLKAREMAPHGTWLQWCAEKINRTPRDIQRLMKIASDADPEAALAELRETDRIKAAETRENSKYDRQQDVGRIWPAVTVEPIHLEPSTVVQPIRPTVVTQAQPSSCEPVRDSFDQQVPVGQQPAVKAVCNALERCNVVQLAYLFKQIFPIYRTHLQKGLPKNVKHENKSKDIPSSEAASI